MNEPVMLVTGSRKGIGRAIARHFASQGQAVIGCSRSAAEWSHPLYEHVLCDVSEEGDIKALFSHIRRRHGRLDHLINNAGIASMNHALLTPTASVEKILMTNFLGTFLCCREAAKLMRKNAFGRIVNFTSVAVTLKLEGEAAYAASKAAVLSLTEILARELASLGVTVNAIGPVPIETDLIRAVPKEKIDAVVCRQAIPRLGSVEDVINVLEFFLRRESGFVTGQNLYLGGV